MKIAFFTENYYVGGLDTYIITLINNWPNKEDDLILICNKTHPGIRRYEREIKREVKFVWHNHFHKNYFSNSILTNFNSVFLLKAVRKILTSLSFFIFIYYFFILKSTLFKFKPDRLMVINGGYPGGLLCRAASICWGVYSSNKFSIHNFHNIAIPTNKFNLYQNFIDKFVEKYSTALISVSNCAAESIRMRESFKSTKKLSFIYNGIVDKIGYEFENLREKLKINREAYVCLMLGTYEERKGHIFVLNAFKEVLKNEKETFLIICGYGSISEKTRVVDCAKELKINNNVIFLDFVDEINSLFAISDLLLIGSQEYESFGLTAAEAMLNRVPVVSTNTGGLKEVIKNGEGGFVFDKDDYIGFSDKIVELLNNKNLRMDQGFKGANRVKNMFSASKMAESYYKIIKK